MKRITQIVLLGAYLSGCGLIETITGDGTKKEDPPTSGQAIKDSATPTDKPKSDSKLPEGMPKATGAEVLTYVTQTSPYRQWKPFPKEKHPVGILTDYIRPNSIRFFNGMIARTYYNDIGIAAVEANEKIMPPGAMIVVERWKPDEEGNLAPEDSPDDILVQYKSPDFDPKGGDWFYMSFKGSAIDVAGVTAVKCKECHELAKDNDYRYTDSGVMDLLAPKEIKLDKDGTAFKNELLGVQPSGLHYTHLAAVPDSSVASIVPRANDLPGGIEWFNGKLKARVYGNPLAMATINGGGKLYPDGAVLVAEQFTKKEDGSFEAAPFAIVAQAKISGADAKHNGWVWFAYSFKEKKILTYNKKAKFCFECHEKVADNDFVWTTSNKLPGQLEGDHAVESVKEPVKEPKKESVKEPIKEPKKEPVKEPIKEPKKEPVKKPGSQPSK
jgi:hypothetical protein